MKLSDVYIKLIQEEPYEDLRVFECDYDSYEEYPIVSRYKKVEYLKNSLSPGGVFGILISLACFVLNVAIISSKERVPRRDVLLGISFTDFDDYSDNLFVTPRIFVFPGRQGEGFLQKLIEKNNNDIESPEMKMIKSNFAAAGVFLNFNFYESRFFDDACAEEIINIYAIPVSR